MSQSCSAFPQNDESQRQMEEVMLQTRMERIGRKIVVLSGKGGVGKSTVAANLAVALAAAGKRVGLLDVDLHGPSVPKILGLEGQRLVGGPDGEIEPIRLTENLSVVSVGLLLKSDNDAVIWRGPMKYNVIRQFLKDVSWGELDFLVVDSPPGTGDEPLAVAQLLGRDASAMIVTTPQDLAVSDVRRSVAFCKTLSLPVLGIVENMSGLACPHCRQVIELFKTGGGERLAEETGVPFLGRIPLVPRVVVSAASGQPFVSEFADSPAAAAFAAITKPILDPTMEPTARTSAPEHTEKRTMKIAIPTADGKLCMHFGHCEVFTFVEVDPAGKKVLSSQGLTPPPHEPGVLPKWLAEQGANLIIAGGMGQRAQGLFAENGIQVIVGAPVETPENIAQAYLNGQLQTGDNVCDH